jgi:hypothetical protein
MNHLADFQNENVSSKAGILVFQNLTVQPGYFWYLQATSPTRFCCRALGAAAEHLKPLRFSQTKNCPSHRGI